VTSRLLARAVFADCGDVEDVRILRESDGKIRGFCYVQFKTADGAKAGLSKNGHALDGKNLKVALSNPGAKRPAAGGGGGGAPLRDSSVGGGRGGKSMLSLVPRAVKRPAPPGSKPGLGSRPQAASATCEFSTTSNPCPRPRALILLATLNPKLSILYPWTLILPALALQLTLFLITTSSIILALRC
jgi:hypothetical protein